MANNTTKRLYRSRTDRKIAGVCGGLGEYFHIDPAIVRLIWIIGTVVTAFVPGIISYVIAAAVMPKEAPQEATD